MSAHKVMRKGFKGIAISATKIAGIKITEAKQFEIITSTFRHVRVDCKDAEGNSYRVKIYIDGDIITEFIEVQDDKECKSHFIYEGEIFTNENNLTPKDLYRNLKAMVEEDMDCDKCHIKDECPIKEIKKLLKLAGKL